MNMEQDSLEKRLRELLEHRIRPLEEISSVQQLRAHHLAESLSTDQLSSPLPLVNEDITTTPSNRIQGNHKRYFDQVQKVTKLQHEFRTLRQQHQSASPLIPKDFASRKEELETQLLSLQLRVNRLEQDHSKLKILNKHLDELDQLPAASPNFLDPKVMFKDHAPLPALPKELTEGFTRDNGASGPDVRDLVSKLKKARLRNQILAQRENRKLKEIRTRMPMNPGDYPPEAQLHALNSVRDSLINWIESMLSKAGEAEDAETGSPNKPRQESESDLDQEAQLAGIQKEYAEHIKLRKRIMTSTAQLKHVQSQWSEMKETRAPLPEQENPLPRGPEPQAYLLTPYLEKLQTLSREQKSLIQEKSHINAIFSKQNLESNKAIDHLVEESNLLQKDRPSDTTDLSKASFDEVTRGSNQSNIANRVQPFIFAADTAKIDTLEAVAEKVEEGHIAIDDAMEALEQARRLLNREPLKDPESTQGEGAMEQDLWLNEPDEKPVRRNTEKTKPADEGQQSIWAKLDGNLGLIND
ncbi:hypothetical protein F5Y15DRAFT_17976 [Xylariaceae sp. FL0016]|nr:hypothetical protein F5Y15DRAFT_17976 [Xylariaceae sp. FL0016]